MMRIVILLFCILIVVCHYASSGTISHSSSCNYRRHRAKASCNNYPFFHNTNIHKKKIISIERVSEQEYENCKNASDSEFICDAYSMKELMNSDIPSWYLTIFQVNQTSISTLRNSTFENKTIETINIHDNEKLITIEIDAFMGLVGLKYLYIENNKVSMNGLPCPVLQIPNLFVPFRNLQTLEVLNLGYNNIRNDDYLLYNDNLEKMTETLPCLRELDLSGNALKFVDSSIFSPLRCSPLTHLSIANVELHPSNGVSKGTFKLLPNLEFLKIGGNKDFVETLSIGGNNHTMLGLRNENFKHLDLTGYQEKLDYIPYNLLVEVNETLEVLILSNNNFPKLGTKSEDEIPNKNVFPTMENLLVLELDSCMINWIREGAFDNIPLLTNLSLKHNKLQSIPPEVYLDSLEHLKISWMIDSYQKEKQELKLPPNFSEGKLSNLKSLSFGHYKFTSKIRSSTFIGLTKLTKIELYDSEMILDSGAFNNLSCLKEVSLAQSDDVPICTSIFNGSSFHLETLNLTSVSVVNNCEENFDYTALEHIKILDLSNMQLTEPSQHLNISKLLDLEILNMDRNRITSWNESFLQQNKNIKKLTMAYQHDVLITLTDSMIQDFNQTSINVLDLSGNKFTCNVEKMVKFYNMSKYRDVIGWNNGKGYICLDDKGQSQSFLDLIQNGKEETDGCCVPHGGSTPKDDTKKKMVSSALVSALVATVVATVLGGTVAYYAYSNMWYVKFWLAKRKIHRNQNFDEKHMPIIYDAFVSYSNDDQTWVHQELAQFLEDDLSLKLCLHERDFSAGLPIVENIVQSLEQSRSCLIVLSNSYTNSEWCNFELNCAYQIFSSENRSIIVMILEEPTPESLSKTLKHILKTKTYLEWKNESFKDKSNSAFWQRLSQTIEKQTAGTNLYTCKI